ncbi:hypothetical protein XENOCAPTIV_009985 [Xenoophorus captivus]|uniref:Uncharacterized protein n=1 Tax=Xenoophorus captivus TaxID=1517983 RepID=A0ABV0Q935_9TELE
MAVVLRPSGLSLMKPGAQTMALHRGPARCCRGRMTAPGPNGSVVPSVNEKQVLVRCRREEEADHGSEGEDNPLFIFNLMKRSDNLAVLSEATEDNLIDLGPGSPAVVSNIPNAAPTSLPPALTGPAGRPSSPATLASRLAGLAENPAAEGPPPTLDVQQPAAGGVSCSNDVLLAVWSVTGGVAIKRSTWYFSKRLPFCCFAFRGRFSSSPQFDLFWFLFRLTQRDLLLLFIGLSIL